MPPERRSYGIREAARKKKLQDLWIALAIGLASAAVLAAIFWFLNWNGRR
jgi:flagellar basal body-associated protein FliL